MTEKHDAFEKLGKLNACADSPQLRTVVSAIGAVIKRPDAGPDIAYRADIAASTVLELREHGFTWDDVLAAALLYPPAAELLYKPENTGCMDVDALTIGTEIKRAVKALLDERVEFHTLGFASPKKELLPALTYMADGYGRLKFTPQRVKCQWKHDYAGKLCSAIKELSRQWSRQTPKYQGLCGYIETESAKYIHTR